MTIAADLGRKATKQTKQNKIQISASINAMINNIVIIKIAIHTEFDIH